MIEGRIIWADKQSGDWSVGGDPAELQEQFLGRRVVVVVVVLQDAATDQLIAGGLQERPAGSRLPMLFAIAAAAFTSSLPNYFWTNVKRAFLQRRAQ